MSCSTRRPFAVLVLLWIVSPFALALKIIPPPLPTPPPPPPVIRLVQADNTGLPIRLDAVSIDVEVQGTQAITRIDLSFFNPNARVLEGQLEFPLLEGQSVIGLAMDVNGKLRDGVPVEKAKGRQVFEDVIRQKIDPALLEVTQGNQYRLRVYPVPATGNKRVVLTIADTLPVHAQNLVYRLPLRFAKQLPQLHLAMRVFAVPSAPLVSGELKNFVFLRHGEVYEGKIDRKGVDINGVFEVKIPSSAKPSFTTQSYGDKTYFQAEIPAPPVNPLPRRIPKRVAVYWDASGSGAARDHVKEFAILDHYFRALGDGEVVLMRFRDRAEVPRTFKIVNGDWRELKSALEKTDYDGATAFGAIAPVIKAGEALLFSDGLNNFDGKVFPHLGIPVYAFSATAGADASALRLIAERSGGQYSDLLKLAMTEVVQRVTHQEVTLARLEGEGVRDLLSQSNRAEHGRWLVAGVTTGNAATLSVSLRLPDGKTSTLNFPLTQASASKLAAYTWARLRLAELDGERSLRRAEIRRVGEMFRLPTPETSLIILDRIEDYVQHKIEPPSELKADYDRLVSQGLQTRQRERGTHLEEVVKRFQLVQAWWNKDFPKDRQQIKVGKKYAIASDDREGQQDRMRERSAASELSRGLSVAPTPQMAPQASGLRRPEPPSPKAEKLSNGQASGTVIALKKWVSDAPYIARFQSAQAKDLYRVYLDERPSWSNSSAFFLDAADALFDKSQTELGLRVLSNLAEMNLENRHILRILGYRLMQAKQPRLAIPVLEQVRVLAPDEPQSHRDLGLAYAENKQWQQAVDALYEVVSHPWHGRFPDVELIALAELNAVIANTKEILNLSRVDQRLLKNLPLDLRVVLSWDADNTDIDLWVTDPNGEKAFYGAPLSRQGGAMSRDFTGGYGPEAFSLKKAMPGKYLVQAQFYGHRQQVVAGATTLQVKLSSGFGTPKLKEQTITLRLKQQSELVTVGEFEVKAGQ